MTEILLSGINFVKNLAEIYNKHKNVKLKLYQIKFRFFILKFYCLK